MMEDGVQSGVECGVSRSLCDEDNVRRPYHRLGDVALSRVCTGSGGRDAMYSLFVTKRVVSEYSTSGVSIASFRGYRDEGVLSSICGVVIGMYTADGDEVLLANSGFFDVVREEFRKSIAMRENSHVLEAFHNMTCGVASHGISIAGSVDGVESGGVSCVHRVYTYFKIPEYALSTYRQKCRWCSDQTIQVIKCFRRMMRSFSYLARRDRAKQIIEGTASDLYTWQDIPVVHDNATIQTGQTPALYAHFERDAFGDIYRHIWMPRSAAPPSYTAQNPRLPFSFHRGKRPGEHTVASEILEPDGGSDDDTEEDAFFPHGDYDD